MSETEFYNHDWKERYFSERENTYRSIRSIGRVFFNITKEYEEKLAKDCCNFTTTEILNMYASCSTRSWEQLLNFNSQLKIYTAWCIKESLVDDNQNHYEEIDKHDLYNCLNLGLKETMILTRDEIEKEIEKFPNVSDQFLVLAFFEGLGGPKYRDFYHLDMSQFKGNVLDLGYRKITVSKKLIAKAEESSETYNKYDGDKILKVGYRKDDPYVLKDTCNAFTDSDDRNIRKVHRKIALLEERYGKAFGYVGLRNSGRIDMLKRLMKEDGCKDIRQTYSKHKEEIENRYGKLQRVFRWIEEYQQFFADSSD